MLARDRARLAELRRRGEWPAIVPSVVLTEALTGDHRHDYDENRLLRTCAIRPVDELLARSAARLRAKTTIRRASSAVDAIVVATADDVGGATVLSSGPAIYAPSPATPATTSGSHPADHSDRNAVRSSRRLPRARQPPTPAEPGTRLPFTG